MADAIDGVRAELSALFDERKAAMFWAYFLAPTPRASVRDLAAVHGLNWRSVWNYLDRALAKLCYGLEPDGRPMATSTHDTRRRIFCALDPDIRAELTRAWESAPAADFCPDAAAADEDQ